MAEPSKYPEWTSNNPGQIIEPDAAKKQAGWAAGERPPNQYMNWLQNLEYLWVKLLNEKTKNIEPIQIRSAATAAWNGATLTFAQPIEIVFRNGNSPTRINQIDAAGSPITLADGEVVVVYRDRTNASPVSLTLQAVYADLAAGQYSIIAESSLTSTKQENEMVLFRRKGTDLEVPMFGVSYPTGATISFGRAFPGAHTHAASDITSGTLADARIAQSNVTQHQAALSIAETQIADGAVFPRLAASESITGAWTFNTNLPSSNITPTLADHLVRKGYVDGASFLPLSGGTMSGNIAMSGNKVTGAGAATGAGDLIRYEQLISATMGSFKFAEGSFTGNGADKVITPSGFTRIVWIFLYGAGSGPGYWNGWFTNSYTFCCGHGRTVAGISEHNEPLPNTFFTAASPTSFTLVAGGGESMNVNLAVTYWSVIGY